MTVAFTFITQIVRIERLSAPDNTTVNVTFQVLNGSEPVPGYYVTQAIRNSLDQALENPVHTLLKGDLHDGII